MGTLYYGFVALLVAIRPTSRTDGFPFEAAYVMGREIDVQVFVFGQLKMKDVPWPLGALHLMDTGDSGRVQIALSSIGVKWTQEMENKFAHLFRQCGVTAFQENTAMLKKNDNSPAL